MRILYFTCFLFFCFGSTLVNGAFNTRSLDRRSLSNTNVKRDERLTALIDDLEDLDGRSGGITELLDDLNELNTLRGLQAAIEDKARRHRLSETLRRANTRGKETGVKRNPQFKRGFWWTCPICDQTKLTNNSPSGFCRCRHQIAEDPIRFDVGEEEEEE